MTALAPETLQLLAYLTRAHAAATLLAQATAIVDWSEVAGWCVRAANHYSAPDAVRLLGASTQVAFAEDDRATLIRECVDSLARAHAIRPLHEIDGALEAAEYALGVRR